LSDATGTVTDSYDYDAKEETGPGEVVEERLADELVG
jgi:hypothetical protein